MVGNNGPVEVDSDRTHAVLGPGQDQPTAHAGRVRAAGAVSERDQQGVAAHAERPERVALASQIEDEVTRAGRVSRILGLVSRVTSW